MSDILENVDKMMGLISGTKDPQAILAAARVQRDLVEIMDENRQLHSKVIELEQVVENSDKLSFKENCYWKANDDGPYCSRCFDAEHLLIRLVDVSGQNLTTRYIYRCNNCHSVIHTNIELPDERKTI